MFHSHLWLGIMASAAILVVCATGILLNHKRPLGLMPGVEDPPGTPLADALPLARLVEIAGAEVEPTVRSAGVDRMDVRPEDGLVKVRFDDPGITEVTLALATGEVLLVDARSDVFLERLHSGEIFGEHGILMSDFAAVTLALLLLSGYWLWLYPRRRV